MDIITTPVSELIRPSIETGLAAITSILLFVLIKVKQKTKLQENLKSSLDL